MNVLLVNVSELVSRTPPSAIALVEIMVFQYQLKTELPSLDILGCLFLAFEMQVVGDTIWYNDFSINPTRLPDGPYKDWRTAPALLKLNIKYPISPNFWEPRDPDYNSDFRNQFLS